MEQSITHAVTVADGGYSFTAEQVEIIKNSVAKGVSDQELAYFLEVCRSTGLNPLHRQIYAIMRKSKDKDGNWRESMTIQTGIDGYRLLAHRSKRHVGTDDAIYDTETAPHPNKATVTVYKHVAGQRCPYTATARWAEYVQTFKDKASGDEVPSGLWAKMPYLMLAKVAEALALRKAFPAETSGLYTDEEMMQADNTLPARIAAPVTVVEEVQEDTKQRFLGFPSGGTMSVKEFVEKVNSVLGLTASQAMKKLNVKSLSGLNLDAAYRQLELQEPIELTEAQLTKIRLIAAPLMMPVAELDQLIAEHGNDFEQIVADLGRLVDGAATTAGKGNH